MSEEKIVIAVLIARPIGAPISALHKILFFHDNLHSCV